MTLLAVLTAQHNNSHANTADKHVQMRLKDARLAPIASKTSLMFNLPRML